MTTPRWASLLIPIQFSGLMIAICAPVHAQSASLTVLHAFKPGTSPASPFALTVLEDGSVIVASGGSKLARPTAARLGLDGTVRVLAQEESTEPLLRGGDGYLYGATFLSGERGFGRVFRLSVDGAMGTVHTYTGGPDDGGFPTKLRRGPDGTLYVSSSHRVGLDATYRVLTVAPDGTVTPAAFTVPGPVSSVEPDGSLIGFTSCCFPDRPLRIFRRAPDGTVSTLADFGVRADASSSSLIVTSTGTIIGYYSINFYPASCHIFRISGTELVLLRSLQDACPTIARPLRERGTTGEVYAAIAGGVWRVAADGVVSLLYRPAQDAFVVGPVDAAPLPDGRVAAISVRGGAYGGGGLFTLPANGGEPTRLASFSLGNADGAEPEGPVVQDADGYLYGTTKSGGIYNCGVVYQLSRTGAYRVLYTFTGSGDGCAPRGLVQRADGAMFGTTSFGESHRGTVFRVGRSGALTTVFVFRREVDGYNPGPLVVGPDGHLYGRTSGGGLPRGAAGQAGTVFRLTPDETLTTIHYVTVEETAWSGSNGPLLPASDGFLYGVVPECPPPACFGGLIFRMTTTGVVEHLARLTEEIPFEPLVQGRDGRIYGSTNTALFSLPASGRLTRAPFAGPSIELKALGPDGRMYGAPRFDSGLFTTTSTGDVAPVRVQPSLDGSVVSTLLDGRDDFLYGGTEPPLDRSAGHVGILFKLQPAPPLSPRNFRIVR